MTLHEKEDALFKRWMPGHDRFYRDGAGAHFEEQNFRVLFLLKEGNDPSGDFVDENDIRDLLSTPKYLTTWKNIARWAALVLDSVSWNDVEDLSRDSMPKYLERIAAMNLKKVSGKGTSKSKEMWSHTKNDAAFILEQVSLYRPHFTIACGTYGYMNAIDPSITPKKKERRHLTGNCIFGTIVDFLHPQARRSPKSMYEGLSDILSELKPQASLASGGANG